MSMDLSLRTFAWLSHERPEVLRRSVMSFVEGVGPKAHEYRYIIAESGRNQKPLDDLADKNFLYIDDTYREKLISYLEKELQAQGFEAGIARFALDAGQLEGSEGVHRNAITLLTQGESFVCTDDDVIFDIKALPSSALQQTTVGTHNFLPFKSATDLQAFEEKASSIQISDFIASHEKALQRVAFSSPGIRGDSAYGGPRFIFTFGDAALEAFCENENFVSEALGSRLIWRETTQSHIVPYAPLSTYMLGMNGRQELAPCFPFGRNVDGCFVYATKALNPASQTAHLKASVSHKPIVDRGAYSDLGEFEFRINDLLWLMWSEWLQTFTSSVQTVDRYHYAAIYFKRIADLSPQSLAYYLTDLARRSLSERALHLESQIERLKAKKNAAGLSAWIDVATSEIALCRKMAAEKKLPLPLESRLEGRSHDERLMLTQQWIRSYSQVLRAWPVMRALVLESEFQF